MVIYSNHLIKSNADLKPDFLSFGIPGKVSTFSKLQVVKPCFQVHSGFHRFLMICVANISFSIACFFHHDLWRNIWWIWRNSARKSQQNQVISPNESTCCTPPETNIAMEKIGGWETSFGGRGTCLFFRSLCYTLGRGQFFFQIL